LRPAQPGLTKAAQAAARSVTYLDAAMICYVTSVFGREAEFKMLWDDGTPRYEPFE